MPYAGATAFGWVTIGFVALSMITPDADAHYRLMCLPWIAGFLIVCSFWRRAITTREQHREQVLAATDPVDGVCPRCKEPAGAHLVDDRVEHPLVAHAVAVEREIGKI